jgi:biopolymer transport protein ExbD
MIPARSPLITALLVTLSVALSGCYSPKPEVKVPLGIALNGVFTFKGKVVSEDELQAALMAYAAPKNALILEIHASPKVSVQEIERAVAVAKRTQTAVAFASEQGTP